MNEVDGWDAARHRGQDPRRGLHRLGRRRRPRASAATPTTLRTAESAQPPRQVARSRPASAPSTSTTTPSEFDAQVRRQRRAQDRVADPDGAHRRRATWSPRSTPSGPRTRSTTSPAPRSPALINQYPTRVKMLHIKDGINVAPSAEPDQQPQRLAARARHRRARLPADLRRRQGPVQYYHQEQDGGTLTDADISFTNLQGRRRRRRPGAVLGLPTSFPSVAAGTAAADNVVAGHDQEHRRRAADHHERDRWPTARARRQRLRDRRAASAAATSRSSANTCVGTDRAPRRAAPASSTSASSRPRTNYRLGRAPAVHLERRRRDRADPADRLEHRRRRSAASAATSPRMLSLTLGAPRELRRVRAGHRPHLRHGRRARPSSAPPATRRCRSPTRARPPRATWSTARSRCRSRCRSARPTPPTRARRSRR